MIFVGLGACAGVHDIREEQHDKRHHLYRQLLLS